MLIVVSLVVMAALGFGSFFRRMLFASAVILAIPALVVVYPIIGASTTVAIAMLATLGWLLLRTIAELFSHLGDIRRLESGIGRTGADLAPD